MARVLIPIPLTDFDPTEVAVPWKILSQRGHRVVFATPDGQRAEADALMLTGEGLDLWGWMPGLKKLKLLGLALRANAAARSAYAEMVKSPAFNHPRRYADLVPAEFDGLLLPGGHRARGMRAYLESAVLQSFVGEFFDAGKPVAAICHGTVLAARSMSPSSGKSVLYGRKTTGLTWKLERTAWRLMSYLGRVWDPDYYRTYLESASEPPGYRSVQAEIERALRSPSDFLDVPASSADHFRKSSGLFRDSVDDPRPAFVVEDGMYLSARWPGDVHTFAGRFCDLLERYGATATETSLAGSA
ncbi:thiJ/pfpI-family protein [Herbaspirillum sp. HC18]|nr:thiJ/pfpI-family protein [Herbaspirillum sp. HC18]